MERFQVARNIAPDGPLALLRSIRIVKARFDACHYDNAADLFTRHHRASVGRISSVETTRQGQLRDPAGGGQLRQCHLLRHIRPQMTEGTFHVLRQRY
ncbi:MAG TPA: hypothetical protein VFG62_11370 [Rhodopila sp.]|jgi:hypothetical protein|nr:hypothetical protein [Rhodopila sp.]